MDKSYHDSPSVAVKKKELLLLGLALFLLTSCGPASQAPTPVAIPTPTPLEEPLALMVDTDMGEDDMRAILYLLKHPSVEVKAITVAGTGEAHCEPGVRHTLGLLALSGVGDIPVACGRETPLASDHSFPAGWRQGADSLYGLSLPEGGRASTLSAPELIASAILAAPEKTVIVATGPLTNVAEALLSSPEMVGDLAMIYIMGGAVSVQGNVGSSGAGIANEFAEWNIYIDPHAAGIVFDSGVPITLVPLDATQHAPVTMGFYQRLESLHSGAEASLVYDLLTANLGFVESGGAQFWDSLTAAIVTDESLATFETYELQVVEEEGVESGRTRLSPGGASVRVAVSANGPRFEDTFLSVLNSP